MKIQTLIHTNIKQRTHTDPSNTPQQQYQVTFVLYMDVSGIQFTINKHAPLSERPMSE